MFKKSSQNKFYLLKAKSIQVAKPQLETVETYPNIFDKSLGMKQETNC